MSATVPRTAPPRRPPPRRKRGGGFLALLLLGAVALALFAVFRDPAPEGPRETVFPLPERYADAYADDWGAPRTQGRHEGTDVFAPRGTPIYSVTDGTVSRAFGSDGDGWNTLGGYTVMIEAAYDVGPIEEGDRLYYAHMDEPTPLEPGEEVEAGQRIGVVGDSGQGPPGTRGRFEPHLHLGWYAGWGFFEADRAEAASGAMNPYPLLRRIERHEAQRENRKD